MVPPWAPSFFARRRGAAQGSGGQSPPPPSEARAVARVTLYGAAGCSLCERARTTLEGLRDELAFELEEVDITGVPELEERYREWLPVVEIDGEAAFTYYVQPDVLRRKLGRQS